MKQMDIFEVFAEQEKEKETKVSKRLFDNHLSSFEYHILAYLKGNHVGKSNLIGMSKLAEQFGVNDRVIRKHVQRLRKYQDVRISSCKQGYYIPLEAEQKKSDSMMISRAITSMDTVVDIDNKYIKILFKHLSDRLKTCDMAVQDQMVIQFNGWENNTVNHYGDKYQKERKQ